MKECRLLVVGPSWVGDMVMAQSLFKSLKFDKPDLVIDVLAPEWSLPITERMPEVNKTIVSGLKHGEIGISKRYNLAKQLREDGYNQAIILPRSIKSALIPWMAGIPVRTGFKGEMRYRLINDMRSLDSAILNQTVKRFVALGVEKDRVLPLINQPRLIVSEHNKSKIINRLDLDLKRPAIGILPGAEYGPAKRWPPNYFSQVIEEYLSKDWSVYILGSPMLQCILSRAYRQTMWQLIEDYVFCRCRYQRAGWQMLKTKPNSCPQQTTTATTTTNEIFTERVSF